MMLPETRFAIDPPGRRLRHRKGAFEIVSTHHQVPIFFGLIHDRFADRDPCIVDQHGHRPESRLGFFYSRFDGSAVAQVTGDGDRSAARGFDVATDGLELVATARGQDHFASMLGERYGEALAQSLRRACNQRHLAIEREHCPSIAAPPLLPRALESAACVAAAKFR